MERPEGNGGGASGLGGPLGAPWRSEVGFQSGSLPAGPLGSAPPCPAEDKRKQVTADSGITFSPPCAFSAYPLKFLANSSLLLQLGLHHFLLFACQLHLLFDALFLLQFLQNKKKKKTMKLSRKTQTNSCEGQYLLYLYFNDLLLVGVGLVLSLHVGLVGAFLLGAAGRVEAEDPLKAESI